MVVALKGAKVAMRREYQQREWVSVSGGGNTEGKPTFLFRGNVGNVLSDQQKAAKWLVVTTEEAWMTQSCWRTFLEASFVPFTKASQADPQLLFVDGHKSRVHSETLTWGTSCGVEVFLLPPHTTH